MVSKLRSNQSSEILVNHIMSIGVETRSLKSSTTIRW